MESGSRQIPLAADDHFPQGAFAQEIVDAGEVLEQLIDLADGDGVSGQAGVAGLVREFVRTQDLKDLRRVELLGTIAGME